MHGFLVIIGDIEKAFLQIDISPKHRDYVRFLWFSSINKIDLENFDDNDLLEYRVCRVLFGLTPSPFLLSATLDKHIRSYEIKDSVFVNELLKSLHVDDLNAGAPTISDAFSFYVKAKEVLAEGQFNLRKFKSNSTELEELVYEKYPEDKLFS